MRVFRPAKPEDFVEIDIIRAENGSTLPREEDVNYFVSDRDGVITAFYGWRMDPVDLRALVIDFYGSKARDWMDLLADMNKHADDVGIQLSGWVDVRNKNIEFFWKNGFSPRMVLVRREPETHKGETKWAS